MEILKARKAWSEVFWALNENNFNPKILHPEKLSFKIDGAIKIFHYKQKLKQYMTTKPPLQKILHGILHTEDESKQNHKRVGNIKHRRRKDKESGGSTDPAAHNQILKQQKQLNGKNYHILININTECQKTTSPSKDTVWQSGLKRNIQQSVVYRRPISLTETNTGFG
jgi:hypothetical protein